MKKFAVIFACVMIFALASCAWCDVPIGPGYFEDEIFGSTCSSSTKTATEY